MSQMWKVAMREIRERGRTKGFIASCVITVLLVTAVIIVPPLLGGGPDEFNIGVVGQGNDAIVTAALSLATAGDDPDEPASVVVNTIPLESREAAIAALEAGDVDAVLVNGEEVIVESIGFGGSSVHSYLQQGAAAVALEELVTEGGETAAEVIAVLTSEPLETTTLSGDDEGGSQFIVAYAGLLLLYLAVLLYGSWILTGVTEEKSSRVVEVLLSALKPWQLLGGKILGIGLLGIGQFTLTILAAVIALQYTDFEIPDLDPLIIANLVLWFVLGFLLFAVLFGAAGSLASRAEDAQSVSLPMSMIAVVGFFVSTAALENPEGTAAVIGTFVPVTAPFVVPVRVALDAIPLWQFVASVAITIVTIIVLVRIAGRIYSGGLLRYGGRVGFREAWRSAAE